MISIVIPVYGQPGVVRDCLESVARFGDGARVIIIDDASPGDEIPQLLRPYGERPRWSVFRNRCNRGFVWTANRGLRMGADGDVVLLNSDTIVTKGWLDKLRGCASARPRVASVTPMTNHGTIAAVPVWNRRNEIGEVGLERTAEICGSISQRLYPEIPTGVGFCMYMTRAAIEDVGVFDHAAFRRGYGEENDWCMRARERGWRHLLDDATYVFHQGGASFAEVSRKSEREGYERVCAIHPEYAALVARFIGENPLAGIQASVRLATSRARAGAGTVGLLLHSPPTALGGTERHTRDLLRHPAGVRYAAFWPEGRGVRAEFAEGGGGERIATYHEDQPGERSTDAQNGFWARFFTRFGVRVLHVQHLLGFGPAPLRAARALGIPVIYVWHDYYAACVRYTLIGSDGRFCRWSTDFDHCARCLAADEATRSLSQGAWRLRMAEMLETVSVNVFPDEAALEGARRIFGARLGRCEVVPHGERRRAPSREVAPAADGRLRIAYVGVWRREKGSRSFAALVRTLADVERIEWHVFGAALDDVPADVRDRLVIHGPYEDDALCDRLRRARIDLVTLLSIWPETFSYTLSEAWSAGVPVLGSHLGAIGRRIAETGGGWVVDPWEPDRAAALVREMLASDDVLAAARVSVAAIRQPSISRMAARYRRLYDELTGGLIAPTSQALVRARARRR